MSVSNSLNNYAGQLAMYYNEVFNFLRTCTIKFSPFSWIYGAELIVANGYTEVEEDWNPYYKSLCGEYQSYHTPMYIFSTEDNKDVLFSRELATTRSRLFNYYKIPNKEYTYLCNKYPTQVDLIKNILYAVDSVATIIKAKELDLLAYDNTLLYSNEREDLVNILQTFLTYVRDRWWTKEYAFEDLYPVAFYFMLWQSLPGVLLTRRMANIHTAQVHPFHIWEYLISNGLSDYRNILTDNQARWLYRNLRWVQKNKGKHLTLETLADNLLTEINVTIKGKDLVQQTKSITDTCCTIPEIVSHNIKTDVQYTDTLTISELDVVLYDADLDNDISEAYKEKQLEEYSLTTSNSVPTKFLELKKGNINTQWEDLLSIFLIETTIYRLITNQINYTIYLNDPTSGLSINLTMRQALALLYYLNGKITLDIPTSLPNSFSTHITYNKDYPTSLPMNFYHHNKRYYINQILDIDTVMSRLEYTSEVFSLQDSFSDYVTTLFKALLTDVKLFRASSDILYQISYKKIYEVLLTERTYNLSLSSYTNYNEWLSNTYQQDIVKLLDYYDNASVGYHGIYDTLLKAIFPITSDMMKLVNVSDSLDTLYKSLKSLFTQLCSYNVTFLDTDKDMNMYPVITNLTNQLTDLVIDTRVLKNTLGINSRPLVDINLDCHASSTFNGHIHHTDILTEHQIDPTVSVEVENIAAIDLLHPHMGMCGYLIINV